MKVLPLNVWGFGNPIKNMALRRLVEIENP